MLKWLLSSFLILSVPTAEAMFSNTIFAKLEYRQESDPPATTDYAMVNASLGDVRSVLGGGTTGQIREIAQRNSTAIEGVYSAAQSLQVQAGQIAALNRQAASAPVSSQVPRPELSTGELISRAGLSKPSQIDLSQIPDPDEGSLPYRFRSEEGEFRRELVQQYKNLYKIETQVEKRQAAREIGLFATEASDESYGYGDVEDANFYKELGRTMLDIAVGLDPFTGFGRSAFELFTGRNLITGAELSTLERGFSFLGVMTLGVGNSARAASRMFYVFDGAGKILRERQAFAAAIHEGQVLAEKVGHLLPGFTKHAHIKAIHTAEEINSFAMKLGFSKPPFQLGSHVVEAKTLVDTQWVRVFAEGVNSPHGSWMMRKSAIKGLTPEQIQKKFALSQVPTHAVDVHVPKGTTFLRGNINDHGLGGNGSVQYWLKDKFDGDDFVKLFKNIRELK